MGLTESAGNFTGGSYLVFVPYNQPLSTSNPDTYRSPGCEYIRPYVLASELATNLYENVPGPVYYQFKRTY